MAEGNLPAPHDPTDPAPAPGGPVNPPAEHAPAGQAPQAAKPQALKKKRRRRWPYVVLVLLLLLGLLVVFLPTIAGTGPARIIIVGQVNQRLNGRIDVADWSLGWTSPVSVSGLRVYDAQGVQVVELPKLTTELTLLNAVRGRLHLGKVTVEGLNALVRRNRMGEINLVQLVPPDPQPQPDAGPAKLPDLRGEVHLVNCRATFEDQVQGQTFYFPSIAGVVKCPDINGAIENAVEVACKVGDAPPGKLTVAGRADVADNFIVDADKMDVDAKVTVEGVELGSFGFALGKDGPLERLAGLTSGAISLRYRGGEGAGVEAQITSTDFAAGGRALKGDTFATQKLTLTVPPTTLAMPAGTSDWKTWALRVGSSGGGDQVVLVVDQGSVALGADTPLSAVARLAANQPPGAAGQVRAAVDLDVGMLTRQMPRALAVQEGLTLSSGRLTHSTDLQLATERATLRRLETRLTEVRGQRGRQPVSLQPINLGFTASTFGGGWSAPKVRDLDLSLNSGFANAAFTGQDLASLSGRASGDLKRLRDELGQVFDLGDLQLSGPFDVQVASKGNVAANEPAALSSTVIITDLLVQTASTQPALRQSRVLLKADGTVLRRPDGSVDRIAGAAVTLSTGDVNRPTIAARLDVPAVTMATAAAPAQVPTASPAVSPAPAAAQPASAVASATYNVAQFAVDLQRAKAEFGDLVPALRDYDFDGGVVNVTGGGRYDNGALTYDGRVGINDLTLSRAPTGQAARAEVIRGYTLTTETALSYAPRGDTTEIRVTKLALDDERGMLSLRGAPDMPLRVVTTAAGTLQPSGRVSLNADLKQLNDVIERLTAAPGVAAAPSGQSTELRSGRLTGTIDLAQAAQNEFFVSSNLQGTELTVDGPSGAALANESIAIVSMVRARDDLSAASIDRLDVTGSVLIANVSGTALTLKVGQGESARAATPIEMVQSATVKATAPDLGKLQVLLDALATPEAPAAAMRPAMDASPAAAWALHTDTTPAGVYFAQARQALPPDQIIGRRPQPAPAQRPSEAQQRPLPQPQQPRPAVPPPPADAAAEEPAPPVKLKGGSAALSLVVRRQDGRVVVTPEVTAQNVALGRGEGSHTLDAVEFRTEVSFIPVAPPTTAPATAPARPAAAASNEGAEAPGPSLAEQMRDLRVPSLTLRGAGTTVTLAEPVVVGDVAALGRLLAPPPDAAARGAGANPPEVKAAVRAEGDVGQLSSLLVALGYIGDPAGPKQPYGGDYNLEQRLTAGGQGLAATGQLNLSDFVAAGNADGGSSFSEKAVRFANDVTLDSVKDALSLRNVALAMESTKALELKLSGNVLNYSTKRELEKVEGTIGYDWGKLWEIVRPMLSREQQENLKLRVAGQAQRQFALGGSYPAVGDDGRPLAFHEAIRFLTGHFVGGFQLVEVNGLQVQNLELPLTLSDGRLVVAYHDRPEGQNYPPAADCNSGKLNLGGATVDLTAEAPRLTMAPDTKLLEGATLNPVFSDMFGGMINNPLFVSPKEARGLVDITVVRCERLPLDTLVLKNARENDGRAEFLFSIREVFLGNSTLMEALKLAGQSEFASSLQGEIRESRVIIERGTTRQDVTINTGQSERPWRIRGSTALETSRLDLTLTVPPQLLRQLGSTGRQAAELLPEGLPIPLGGTTRAPQLDLNRALTGAVKEGLIPGLLRRATGADRGGDRAADAPPPPREGTMPPGDRGTDGRAPAGREPPPATEPPKGSNPLGDLFDAVGRQREQREREKQDEREKRRRERERQQQGAADSGEARPAAGASGAERIGRQPARGRDRDR